MHTYSVSQRTVRGCHSSRIRFLRFFLKIQNKRDFLRLFEVSRQKNVKNVESVVQVFTFLHFKIANEHFHCKTVTYMSCYTHNTILKLFIFGKNMALLLCERQQNWLRVVTMVFRTIGIYVITSTFFTFFTFFQNPKSRDFLRFLPCFVRFLELWPRPTPVAMATKFGTKFVITRLM